MTRSHSPGGQARTEVGPAERGHLGYIAPSADAFVKHWRTTFASTPGDALRHPSCFPLLLLLAGGLTSCEQVETPAETPQESAVVGFTDVTAQAGLSGFRHENGARGRVHFPELMGSGGGFIDYDGDMWLDILLVGGGLIDPEPGDTTRAVRLYHNNRDGSFREVTEEAGLDRIRAYGKGIALADYDNDGDEDLYLTTLGDNQLLRNDGGRFARIGDATFESGQAAWSASAVFFDADRDGDLDLYETNYTDWAPDTDVFCSIQGVIIIDTEGADNLEEQYGQKIYCPPSLYEGIPNRYFMNNGDGSFTDRTTEAGFTVAPGKSLGVAELDVNRDGWPDLVVANDGSADRLYMNRGDGTFEEVGERSGIAFDETGKARAGMGIDTGVVDESGLESIFVGNFSSEMIGVYQHSGSGPFTDRAVASKIGPPSFLTLTFGLILFDAEYDGDLDLLAANGHVWAIRPTLDGSTYRQRAQLFVNQGDGVFAHQESVPGGAFEKEMVARGASYGDFDRDGDLDVLLTENGGPAHLWRNDLGEANYLRVRLEGTRSNREGLGTQIVAVVNDRRMYARIRTGSSYLSQSEKVASFGLGSSAQVDSVMVYWPSGEVDVLVDVQGNREIILVEGTDGHEVVRPDD